MLLCEQQGVRRETDRQGQPGHPHGDGQAGVEHSDLGGGAPDAPGQPELEDAEEEAKEKGANYRDSHRAGQGDTEGGNQIETKAQPFLQLGKFLRD